MFRFSFVTLSDALFGEEGQDVSHGLALLVVAGSEEGRVPGVKHGHQEEVAPVRGQRRLAAESKIEMAY